MFIVKNTTEHIIKPFTYVCNQSLKTGTFPDAMRIAKVIPIYKNGERQAFSNYRPISLLPLFSKILEKVFANRVESFVDKHNLLSIHQYGFRTNCSTSVAVMKLVEDISTAMDNREDTIGIFIDLKKTFDTIDNNILLHKLERYGFRGIANTWLKNYLDNRCQYMQINDVRSNMLKITQGVPQGSVLGPKLFILYINDICSVTNEFNYVLFADDTTLYCSGENLELLLSKAKKGLQRLKNWFDLNKLSLNIDKTKLSSPNGKLKFN